MAYDRNYGGIIWTNHALSRMLSRGVKQENALRTFRNPDEKHEGKYDSTIYKKLFGNETITLVVKKGDRGDYLVVSAWMDPPLPGSKDAREKSFYLEYKKAKGLKKFFLLFKRQLGF